MERLNKSESGRASPDTKAPVRTHSSQGKPAFMLFKKGFQRAKGDFSRGFTQ